MKKFIIGLLFSYTLAVSAEPLAITDWQQPYKDKKIDYTNYTSILNCEKKTPYYVFFNLYVSDFDQDFSVRKNKWPTYVPEEIQAICSSNYAVSKDYTNSGYDRGHLAPAGDFKANQDEENSTFSFANAAPQNKTLNRGNWEKLEKYERSLAIDHAGVTIITGVIQSNDKYIGKKVGVPDYFYKIILWKENGKIGHIAFLVPNINSVPKEIDITLLEKQAKMNFGF